VLLPSPGQDAVASVASGRLGCEIEVYHLLSAGPIGQIPVSTLYFEDFDVDRTFDLGSVTVTADEIRAFARQFDPQPFHLDADAAREAGFETLVASGLHTLSLSQRLASDAVYSRSRNLAGLGFDEVRFRPTCSRVTHSPAP